MASNLRYLLEHFCLDGQKIDISSQLDEENANNIEKINTQTVPSINARIDDIKNTDIPNINSRIDSIKNTDIPSINQKINTINNATIPNVQTSVNAVDEKADRINETVAKNTRDIGTLSDNVTMQGNAINSIETEKIPSVENNVSANTDSINAINNTTIPSVQASVTAVDEKADRINESVAKNTRDIGTLSDNVTMQGNAINSINTEKIPSIENNVEIITRETQKITAAHDHDINGINESLSVLHGETSDNTTNIGNLTTNVNELTTKVDTNTDNINKLTSKVSANTDSINTINNTSIPHLQEEIDNLSGGGTGSEGELRTKVEKNTSDISELNGKVETNTADISALSGYVDSNTTDLSAIKNRKWNKIIEQTSNGMHINIFRANALPLVEIYATLTFPQSIEGSTITMRIPGAKHYAPHNVTTAPVYLPRHSADSSGYLYAMPEGDDLIVGFTITGRERSGIGSATILYRY